MVITHKASLSDGNLIADLLMQISRFASHSEALAVFEREYSLHYHYRIAYSYGAPVGLVSWRTHGLLKHGVAKLKRIGVVEHFPDSTAILEMLFDAAIAEAE